MSENDRTFAFGSCEIDGTVCPAKVSTIGFSSVSVLRVAARYDANVRLAQFEADGGDTEDVPEGRDVQAYLGEQGYDEGVVDEETARECWLDATDEAEGGPAKAGEAIAADLGWVDA